MVKFLDIAYLLLHQKSLDVNDLATLALVCKELAALCLDSRELATAVYHQSRTRLQHAAGVGDVERVQQLLRRGAQVW